MGVLTIEWVFGNMCICIYCFFSFFYVYLFLFECEEYRPLCILTNTSKIFTLIILGRIQKKNDRNLAEDQFGFRMNRDTREAILCL